MTNDESVTYKDFLLTVYHDLVDLDCTFGFVSKQQRRPSCM